MFAVCPTESLACLKAGSFARSLACFFARATYVAALAFMSALVTLPAQAQTWQARPLYEYLKKACDVAYQVEEAITDGNGNVQRDAQGNVRTRWVTRTRIDHSCVPGKFSQLRVRQRVEFEEVSESFIGSDHIFFKAGPVDFKCIASASTIKAYKGTKKGTPFVVEGTLVGWEPRIWNDNFVMRCDL